MQQQNSEKIHFTLRTFIQKFSEGESRTAELLARNTELIKDHVTAETVKLETTISKLAIDSKAANDGLSTAVVKLDNDLARGAALSRDDARHERLLRSLKYPTMNARRNQIVDPGFRTFQWIFEEGKYEEEEDVESKDYVRSLISELQDTDPDFDETAKAASRRFLQWLQTHDETLFWISGKPGSGKSTLMKFLTDDPRTLQHLRSSSPDAVILSHFIWSAGEMMERKIKGLLCSLLFQLTEEKDSEMPGVILNKFPRTRSKESTSD